MLTTSSCWTFCTMEQIVVCLFAVFLLQLSETKGVSAGTPVFVKTGKDLFLHVNKRITLEEGDDLTWRINDSKNIGKLLETTGKPIFFGLYKGRADLNGQNYSLLLKNVQHSDSGVYKARVSGENDSLVAAYKVTVQDPVSPVQLTIVDSCNLTVTCSTVDSHISSTFRCDNQTCSQEGGERSEVKTHPSSINVYVEHGHIICNHSNQVSWTQENIKIKSLCQSDPVTAGVSGIAIGAGAGAGATIVGIAALTVLFIKYKKKNNSSTVYEVPQDIKPAQTLNENPTEDASGLSPTSTYCLVTFHTGPGESNKPKNNPKPETVYAQVNRAAKTNCRSDKNQNPDLERTDLIYMQD